MTNFTNTNNPKGTSMNREQEANRTSTPITGFVAMLSNLLRGPGTSARSRTRALLAVLALAIAAFAVTAAPASADSAKVISVTEASYASAHVKGEVITTGPLETYSLEFSTDQLNWTLGPGGSIGAASKNVIEHVVSVPKGSTKYFVRIGVFSLFGSPLAVSPEPNPSFTTLPVDPPSVLATDNASEVAYTTATVSGEVSRPANADPAFDVNCHFQYVTDVQFTEHGFENPAEALCEPQGNPTESPIHSAGPSKVSAKLAQLTPGTAYHLRLLVSNASPTTDAKESASPFTTLPVDPPSVISIDNAGEVEYTQAEIAGEIHRPAGTDPAFDVNCNFEYVSDTQFGETGFEGATQVGCEPENPLTSAGVDSSDNAKVHAKITGLAPATTYHLRLGASNGGGADHKEAAATFATLGPIPTPTVLLTESSEVAYTTTEAKGEVQRPGGPGGADPSLNTSCQFEYITDAQFKENEEGGFLPGFEGATPVPCEQGPIETPGETVEVSAQLTGLALDTTYHLRLSAFNGGGVDSKAAAATFTTKSVAKPTIALDPVTTHTDTTAKFTGTVDANAPAGPLDDPTKVAYKTNWQIECAPECKDAGGNVIGGTVEAEEGAQPFALDAVRLHPNTKYEVTITATNLGGTSSDTTVFTTTAIPPTVKSAPGASDGNAGYTLQGVVNPNNSAITACKFVYGPNSESDPAKYPFAVPCSPATPRGRDEVQNIIIVGCSSQLNFAPSEGQFKLSFRGQATLDLPFDATAAEVEAALEALSTIGSENVAVTLTKPVVGANLSFVNKHYEVTFKGSLAEAVLPSIQGENGTSPLHCDVGNGIPDPGKVEVSTAVRGGNDFPVTVEGHVTGLTPGATYHFRLVVTNAVGTEVTEDQIFEPTLDTAQPCPNEQLRKENSSLTLPECRAYEMVSPPNKQGFPAGLAEFTEDGTAVAYSSQAGNIANSGSGLVFNPYVANRTNAGWETIPNLNGSLGSPFAGPEGFGEIHEQHHFSADLRSSLWFANAKGLTQGAWHPYIRNSDGSFTLVGSTNAEVQDFPENYFIGTSDDLSHLVFNGESPPSSPIWGPGVYEFAGTGSGLPRRVDLDNSRDPISTCGPVYFTPGGAFGDAVSKDGGTIVVTAIGGCGGGNPAANEVWARVGGTASYDVSASRCSPACAFPEAPATFQGAAADGSRVFFTTTAQLLNSDTDETSDLYACDIPTGSPTPTGSANPCSSLHQISGPAPGAQVEKVVRVSDDGSTVYFTAKGVLAENEDALGEKAVAGDHNLYVWRTDAAHPGGQTTFVARLELDQFSRPVTAAQTTADGRYLIFTTATQLVPTDTDNSVDVYRYDAAIGRMTRVSTNVFGVAGNAEGTDASIIPAAKSNTASVADHHSHPAVSDDGEAIVFTTSEGLSPLDGNDQPDVYLWTAGHVSLISTGAVGFESSASIGSTGVVAAIDGSGRDIYFNTVHQLTPGDGDDVGDIYDARVEGGISAAQAPPCSGETCQPQISPPPPPKPRASEQPGPGNPSPPKHCAKGKVRKHGKCVKKGSKKHSGRKHHGKKASHKQGGGK